MRDVQAALGLDAFWRLRCGHRGLEPAGDVQVDSADAHGNTLLSEAAVGGATATAELLLQRGADPNSQGEFRRTPLWRAAFLGKSDLILPLLSAGADPRIPNEAGELPEHVAATPAIKAQIQAWDTRQTDELLQAWQQKQEIAAAKVQERLAAELRVGFWWPGCSCKAHVMSCIALC